MESNKDVLLKMEPAKLMWHLSLPAIVGVFISSIYGVIDAIFIGRMISKEAMGAVTMASSFTIVINAVGALIGVGSASILSRAIGSDDKETMDKVLGNCTFLSIAFSVIIMMPAIYFSENIMLLTGAKGKMLSYGSTYLKIIFLGSIFACFAFAGNVCLRASGKMKEGMRIVILGSLINVVLNPIFILIFKKYNMAVEGASLSTIVSQFIKAIITFYYLKRKSGVFFGKIKLAPSILKELLSIGFSAMILNILGIVQFTIIFKVISIYGSKDWQILMSASIKLNMLFVTIFYGLSQAFQPAIGANYGAKNYDRVTRIVKEFFKGVIMIGLPCLLVLELFPVYLFSMFIDDIELVKMGVNSFRILVSTFIFLGFINLATSFFQAIGKAKLASYIVLGRVLLVYIPLVIFLPRLNNLGVSGVWVAHGLSGLINGTLSIIFIILTVKKINKTSKDA